MTPFLLKIAQEFFAREGNELYRFTFVFPNRRSGLFFQKYLGEVAGRPLFSPKIITIQDLFQQLSPLRLADKTEMLVMLYQHYTSLGNAEESFDDFLYWGEMLLNDFSDVDKHLVDAAQLFRNIHNFKSIDDDMDYLTQTQIEAIRQFWDNFQPYENNETKSGFLEIWQILYQLYLNFRSALASKNYAYEGMLYREVAERAKKRENLELPFSKIVFVGLNALSPAEVTLLEHLKNLGIADFYWDYDSPLVNDKKNRAALWAQDNLTRFPSKITLSTDKETASKPNVNLIGVPSGVGQTKIVSSILLRYIEEQEIHLAHKQLNTAIVLPDENLLLPLLYAIPEDIKKINVTMGYALNHASVASLINHLALMHHNTRIVDGKYAFYYRFVLSVLNHPLVIVVAPTHCEELKSYIMENNRVLISAGELDGHPFFHQLFSPVDNWRDVAEYLRSILSKIYNHLSSRNDNDNNNVNENTAGGVSNIEESDLMGDASLFEMVDKEQTELNAFELEKEFIVEYYKSITRLQEALAHSPNMTTDTYFRLLKKLAQNISVSFTGEPLSGLQIMGILETRALDFENLIILSMNEGVLPPKKSGNSFIPYTLRRGFDLPTHDHQDSIYAYHFYRMISRAKNIHMLYDTRTEDMQTGEVSRYYYQMKYLYADLFNVRENIVSYKVSAPDTPPVSLAKTDVIYSKLQKYKEGGDSNLSASLINNYINCPLQFYFSAVEGLAEEVAIEESVEAGTFGTMYHGIIQKIYDQYRGATVLPDTINNIVHNEAYLTDLIEKTFARHYFKDADRQRPLTGHHFLIGEILRDYVIQTLKFDHQYTPFEYIYSEYNFKKVHRVSNHLSVNVKGSIDRIDRVDNIVRIIDYKSGKGKLNFNSIDELFDGSKKDRPYQILQVFFYALFYKDIHLQVSPAIYYLREIFNDKFNPVITFNKTPIIDIAPLLPEFTKGLNAVLEEIFDKNVPFKQTSDSRKCEWCAFKDVCMR